MTAKKTKVAGGSKGVNKASATTKQGFKHLFAGGPNATPQDAEMQPSVPEVATPEVATPEVATPDVSMEHVPDVATPNRAEKASTLAEASAEKTAVQLSPEQLSRIAENRQKALARQLAAPQLNPEQLKRIEESRQKARERQLASKASQVCEDLKLKLKVCQDPVTTSPTRSSSSSKGSSCKTIAVTPVKTNLPQQERTPVKTDPPQQERQQVLATGGSHSGPSVSQGRSSERCEKFGYLETGVWMQYNTLYQTRLQQLRGPVLAEARTLWSGAVPPEGFVSDITGYRGTAASEVVIVGIVFKEMKARPNVIEQYKGLKVGSSVGAHNQTSGEMSLCSEADVLWLEDSTMRVQLVADEALVARLPTGIVAAFRGTATPDGHFCVTSLCLPRVSPPPALSSTASTAPSGGSFLALISGIAFPGFKEEASLSAARARAVQFLLGRGEDQQEKVRQVIWCGGALSVEASGVDAKTALKDADALLAELAAEIPVHVMPGHGDPTNLSLPQMPLHPHLFKTARGCKHFKSVSNPYSCSVDADFSVLGHAGQPVGDILRCTNLKAPLEALEMCLGASHLAPTAPDTLACQPFTTVDPFVIQEMPHLLFSGGHGQAAHSWQPAPKSEHGTSCICVPDFGRQQAVVLVNLSDPRDVRVHEFGRHANGDM